MKKFFKTIFVFILLLAVALTCAAVAYTKTSDYTDNKFPGNITINGVDCSGLTYEDASKKISDEWNSRHVVITGSFNDELASFTDFGFTYDINEQLKTLKHDYLVLAAANHYFHTPISAEITMIISDYPESFKEKVTSSKFLGNSNSTVSKDAYVDISDPDFPIIKEVYGTKPDEEKFFKDLLHSIETGRLNFIFDEKQYYTMPKITSDDKSLKEYQKYCREYLKQKITYQLGKETFTISPEQLEKMMLKDHSGKPDREAVRQYVSKLAEKYDNVGIRREFTSYDGDKISISGGTYGWEIAQEDETDQLVKDITSHKDISREPVYYIAGYGAYTNTMGDTYIDVNISKQVVKFYKNGNLVFSSKCVTGCRATGHNTDIGIYYILNKVQNVVLKGDNGDGTEYESPVKYWMGVTWTGQGFHDADWRNTFGGNIWKTSGSHGCINMPPSKMPSFYEKTDIGIPVIMHY